MNPTELRDLQRRLDRALNSAKNVESANRRVFDELSVVRGMVSEQLDMLVAAKPVSDEVVPRRARAKTTANPKLMTEDDVLDLIRRIFGTGEIKL